MSTMIIGSGLVAFGAGVAIWDIFYNKGAVVLADTNETKDAMKNILKEIHAVFQPKPNTQVLSEERYETLMTTIKKLSAKEKLSGTKKKNRPTFDQANQFYPATRGGEMAYNNVLQYVDKETGEGVYKMEWEHVGYEEVWVSKDHSAEFTLTEIAEGAMQKHLEAA